MSRRPGITVQRAAPTLACVLACVGAFGSRVASGADHQLDASITGRVEYSDNLSLRVDENPGWHFVLTPQLRFARSSETNRITAVASVGINEYSDDTVNDSNDRALSVSIVEQLQRSQLGLDASYRRETTALGQAALGGGSLGTEYTDWWNVSPYWNYSLTERTTLQAGVEYQKKHYQRVTGNDSDEVSLSVSGGFSYAITPVASAGVSLAYTKFETSPDTSESEGFSVNGTFAYTPTDRLTLSGAVGIQRTKQTQFQDILVCPVDPVFCQLGLITPVVVGTSGSDTYTNFPFSANLKWAKSERETVTATASNAVGQYGTGTTSVETRISLGYGIDLSERLNAGVSAWWRQSRTLGRDSYENYLSLSPTLSYKLAERWTLGAGYIYDRVRYRSTSDKVQANTVFATLGYDWPLWRAAR